MVAALGRRAPAAAVLAAALVGAACSKGDDLKFPSSFLLGTAISGFQAEMGCPTLAPAICEDRSSDWYAWITNPKLIADPGTYLHGDPPSSGPGFYELYPQDHTLPSWIHDAAGCHQDLAHCSPRGWLDREVTVREAAKYAGFAAREFGGEVDLWATLNEPFTAVILAGYLLPSADRTNPPGVTLKWDEGDSGVAAKWISESLWRTRVAMSAGIDIRGYLYWTLMDNYEWNHGMSARYGLYAVDINNPQKPRTQRAKAAGALARIALAREIPADLVPAVR